ncbi:Transmembrane protease serine 3 [Bulinus truncatus]|nr:Transmembrane protease serine 3 [Bulinus truncatus]
MSCVYWYVSWVTLVRVLGLLVRVFGLLVGSLGLLVGVLGLLVGFLGLLVGVLGLLVGVLGLLVGFLGLLVRVLCILVRVLGYAGTCPVYTGTCPAYIGTCPGSTGTCPGSTGTCPGSTGTCPGSTGSAGSNDPKRWQIIAGKHHLNKIDPGERTVNVAKIFMHTNYNNNTIANDIALLLLEQPLTYSNVIRPICLPTEDQGVRAGENCLLAGWGATKGTADQLVLNQVVLPIISDDICALEDWYGPDFLPNTTFCAGYEQGGQDGCSGDSGGSLICRRNGLWYSQGIHSWGYGCGEFKWPGIYTDVSKYSQWIFDTIQHNTQCTSVGNKNKYIFILIFSCIIDDNMWLLCYVQSTYIRNEISF